MAICLTSTISKLDPKNETTPSVVVASSHFSLLKPRRCQLNNRGIREMIGQMSANQLMKRVQRYVAKIQGTKQYWYQLYQELKALITQKGVATLPIIIGQIYADFFKSQSMQFLLFELGLSLIILTLQMLTLFQYWLNFVLIGLII